MGYVKARSALSLAVSLGAAAAIVGGVLIARSNKSVGYGICGAVALALAIFFGYRLATTASLMPGLPALILSFAALAALAFGHFTEK